MGWVHTKPIIALMKNTLLGDFSSMNKVGKSMGGFCRSTSQKSTISRIKSNPFPNPTSFSFFYTTPKSLDSSRLQIFCSMRARTKGNFILIGSSPKEFFTTKLTLLFSLLKLIFMVTLSPTKRIVCSFHCRWIFKKLFITNKASLYWHDVIIA